MLKRFQAQFQCLSTKIAIAFFLVSAVPLVIGFEIINRNAIQHAQLEEDRKLYELVTSRERLLSEHIEHLQDYAETTAKLSSISAALHSNREVGFIEDQYLIDAARELASIQSVTWGKSHHIFITDAQGTVVLSPPKYTWEDGTLTPDQIRSTQSPHYGDSIADASYFEQAKRVPTVTGFFGFEERDHYHQLVLHPVLDDEGFTIGIVCIEVDIEDTQDLLHDNFLLGVTGELFLTTDQGERVVHHKTDEKTIADASDGLIAAIENGTLYSGRYQKDTNDVLGVYLPSRIYPWVVCIEIDYSEVMHSAHAQQRHLFIVGGMILVLCFVTAILVSRIFGTPIKQLVNSANAVAGGDLFCEIETTSSDEIGQLQSAVNDMRCSLKQQIDLLDYEVSARTEELSHLNEQLLFDSKHDKLTGLANRELFCARLEEELAKSKDNDQHQFSVLFFDFDRFKLINDSLGHAAGDALLCSIADRFRMNLRETDLAARFGGDEFVVMLSYEERAEHTMDAANRLLKLFEKPHFLNGHKIYSTASIGVVVSDSSYSSTDDMIRDADAAMYQAKLNGKGCVVRFDKTMHESAKFRLRIEEDLNKAVDQQELHIAYQPIVDLDTLTTVGFEALIRWNHPELGWIRPDQFIEIAEDTGQILQVGQWILERAVKDIKQWNLRFPHAQPLSVNVNVSKRQLQDNHFIDILRAAISSARINPSQLKIEITESTIVDPRSGDSMRAVFNEIRDMGVQIAMDDFGTGHSSLSLLHKYKFDVLKIDQSFIRDMELNRDIGAVLHATIELAKNTGMTIVAEGVETEDQVTALIAHGCDLVQGYYFAKPMFVDEVNDYLANPNIHKKVA